MSKAVPEKFAKYRVDKILGKGAMGVVYAGFDPGIGRKVAIKTVHAHLLQGDDGEEFRNRFTREIRAVGKLSHPNIVAIYDTDGVTDAEGVTIPYFVMEFVEGKELQDLLAEGQQFTPEDVISIALQILDAFSYTHQHAVVHRDVKPANIFVSHIGQVKIADFGIARIDNFELTQTGAVIGTPNYMSPEQCSGHTVDARSDLFAIGVLIYEMLTGRQPFNANGMHAIMLNIIQLDPAPPSSINPSVPPDFDIVIAKALAKSPEDRYQTAQEFADALEAIDVNAVPDNADRTRVMPASRTRQRLSETVLSNQPTEKVVEKKPLIKQVVPYAVIGLVALTIISWVLMQPEHKRVEEATDKGQQVSGAINNTVSTGQQTATDLENAGVDEESPPAVARYSLGLSAEDQRAVDKLLTVAEGHEKAGRLVFPPSSSANYVYRLVLERDPQNPVALQGLQNIADTLIKQANDYFAAKDFELLHAHLETSLAAFPGNPELKEINYRFNQIRDTLNQ